MSKRRSLAKPADAYHHGDLRQTLLSVALAQIEQSGPDSISLAALARDLHVSQSAPYRHFDDKGELLAAVAAEGFRMFVASLQTSIEGVSGRRAVAALARAYVTFGQARPGLYDLMFASGIVSSASDGDEVKMIAGKSFAILVRALAPSRVRNLRALRIWAGLHGAVMLDRENLFEHYLAGSSLDDLIETIIA
jgi:AcrR family transcriptional regulator